MSFRLIGLHKDVRICRVVRQGWANPLDASHSQKRADNRWNTAAFPALYCCCCEKVARAVAFDVFRLAGVVLEDLQPAFRPRLVVLGWTGEVVDVATPAGVRAAGFDAEYPDRTAREETRKAAAVWHGAGASGVVCRSASLARTGFHRWEGPYHLWSELAIFVRNCRYQPFVLEHRTDLDWLSLQ